MTKRERKKGQTTIYKTSHIKLKLKIRESNFKNRGELRCSRRVNSSCFTCDTSRVTVGNMKINTTNITKHEPLTIQMEVKTNRTSILRGHL